MKKNIKVLLVCVVAVLALTVLAACDSGETPTDPVDCAHQGGEATCLEPAVCALCGEFYGEAKGHSFGQWTVETAASCEAAGEEVRTCSCGAAETRELAATGHSFGQWTVKTAASCEVAGEEIRTCSCGAAETRVLAATGHSFGQWTVKTAAGCEAAGEEVRTCSCGAEEQQQIPALGHQYEVSYKWSEDNISCTASATCKNDETHTLSETVRINAVILNVTAEQVTYVYKAEFENDVLEAQTRSVDGTVDAENGLVTIAAPAISGLVPSHDYVKFSFRDGEAEHSFVIYYSEVDVWDGVSVSTSLSGSGTQADPYLIQSGADLAYLKSLVDAAESYKDSPCSGQYFKLTKSIDLGGANFMIGSHTAWNNNKGFAGIFDGNNCSIRGLNIETTGKANAALFGCVKEGAVVKNLIGYGSVKSELNAGAVVVYLKGTLENVTNYASVTGKSTVGGVVANAEAKKTVSTGLVNYGSITSSSYLTGGIAGSLSYSISDATNWGTVTSAGNVNTGGIAGACHKSRPGTLTNCANYGTVDNNGKPAGHIAGVKNGHTYVNCDESHNLTKTEAKEATCAGAGSIEYYQCAVCQERYDAEGNVLTGDVTIPALSHSFGTWETTAMPTCETTGAAKRECECGEYEMIIIPALGHSYGKADYEWSEDGFSCTASVTCPNGTPHILEETATIVASLQVSADKVTCTYKAVFENERFVTQTGKTVELTATVENGLMIVTAPEVPGLVPSHDYVIFDFHNEEATYTFEIYYSELDVWDGVSVSESLEGSGTAEDPYLIQSGADLKFIADTVNNLGAKESAFSGKYFKLTKSINLNGEVNGAFHIGTGRGWSTRQIFGGYFDGNNCSIRGINNTLALFATVEGGWVKNISIYGKVTATEANVGALVGYLYNATLENITNYADVTGAGNVGGLVGNMQQSSGKTSKNLVNYGSVTGTSTNVGGIAGLLGANISDSTNWGTVTGTVGTGGIAASCYWDATVTNCSNYGHISGTKNNVGGIAGFVKEDKTATISNCTNNGEVSGYWTVGGILGHIEAKATATITNCTNNADINGKSTGIGGILGTANEAAAGVTITECTNNGDITKSSWGAGGIAGNTGASVAVISKCANNGAVNGEGQLGGIVGRAYGQVIGCTNNGSIIGTNSRIGGIAGDANATVTDCINKGTVGGANTTSGILGFVASGKSATITNCTNNGIVTGETNCSGIFGFADANAGTVTITGCTNNGTINGTKCTSVGIAQITASSKAVVTECVENGSATKEHGKAHVPAKDPTCEEAGNVEYYHCSDCGKNFDADGNVLEKVEKQALKHNYGEATYTWSADNSTCTATKTCANDAAHIVSETATVTTVALSVTADKVTYTYNVVFANSEFAAQTKSVEADVTLVDSIATIDAPEIAERVASHDYVKFGFHNTTATYEFTIYYSEIDVWDGTTVSTGLSGSGTAEDPYLIQSGADLAYLKSVVDAATAYTESPFAGKYFKMTKSIDLNGANFMIGYHSAWNKYDGFAGVFDGNNCTIRGININPASDSSALFACVKKGGAVKNLSLYGSVKGNANVASAVAYLLGTAENITSYVTVSGASTLGGVIANAESGSSVVSNCVNYGTVTGTSYIVGGIAGSGGNNITNCTNWAVVTGGDESVGGIAGTTKNTGTISGCYNYGDVSTTSEEKGQIGGIAGTGRKPINDCVNYGTITGANQTGGIVGKCIYDTTPTKETDKSYGAVSNCKNYGNINAGGQSGGVVGSCASSVSDCINYGDVNGAWSLGGIVGYVEKNKSASISDCTNYGNVNGSTTGNGGILGLSEWEAGTVTIDGCKNYGNVTASWGGGGIAGDTRAPISNCVNNGNVSGDGQLGGIVGKAFGAVTGCTNNGAITASKDIAGGICGETTAEITDCENNGVITVNNCSPKIDQITYSDVAKTDCTSNGRVVTADHTLTSVAAKAATCIEAGNVAHDHCSACGKNFDEEGNVLESVEDSMLKHEYDKVVTEPTCTADGYTTYTCKNGCKDSYTGDPVSARHKDENSDLECDVCKENLCENHVPAEAVKENEVDATCTVGGSYDSVVKCSECGFEMSRTAVTVDALGHSYSTSYVWSDDKSTCTATKTCANDASDVTTETVTVSTVTLNVSATKVTCTYNVVFANSEFAAQTTSVDKDVALVDSIATIDAPAIAGRVASHKYVKFGFHDATATYTFTIYYSEIDVWDGTSVSTELSGSGTAEDPYLIQSAADLAYVAKVVNDAAAGTANFKGQYFKMTKSIDLGGNELKIGGYSAGTVFHGYFDGNNCSVRGINATQSLFGMLKDGYIKNLSTYGTVTTTEKKGVAGLVSYISNATVENVTNYVNVTGVQQVAGVIGWLSQEATAYAVNCVNYGTIKATSYQIGGIAGFAKGTITGCTNFGDVSSSGNNYIGGIGGAAKDAKGTLSDCVNYGNISGKAYVGGCFGMINKTATDCYSYGTVKLVSGTATTIGEVVGSGKDYLVYTNTAN